MTIKLFKRYTKLTYFFLFVSFAINFLRFMSIPFLTVYLTSKLSVSLASIGFIIGVPALVQLIIGLFAARIVDKISFKWGTVFSLILPLAGLLGYIFFTNYSLLILSSIISGIGWSIYNPLILTALSNTTAESEVDSIMNLNYWIINLGGAAGPIIGVLIGGGKSAFPFLLFGLILFILSLLAIWIVPDKIHSTQSQATTKTNLLHDFMTLLKDRNALLLFASFFCIFFIEVQYETSFSIYLNQTFGNSGLSIVATMLTIITITIIVAQPLSMFFTTKKSSLFLAFISFFFYTLAIILFFSTKSIWLILGAAIFFALGEIFIAPKLQGITAKIAPPHLKTTYFSFTTLGGNLAYFIGPTVGNFLLARSSTLLFIALIAISMLAILANLALPKTK